MFCANLHLAGTVFSLICIAAARSFRSTAQGRRTGAVAAACSSQILSPDGTRPSNGCGGDRVPQPDPFARRRKAVERGRSVRRPCAVGQEDFACGQRAGERPSRAMAALRSTSISKDSNPMRTRSSSFIQLSSICHNFSAVSVACSAICSSPTARSIAAW